MKKRVPILLRNQRRAHALDSYALRKMKKENKKEANLGFSELLSVFV